MDNKELIMFNLLEISDTLESLKRRINHIRSYVESQDTRLRTTRAADSQAIELLRRIQASEQYKYISLPIDWIDEIDAILKTPGRS